MANPIIKILRGATPPSATLQAGQLAMDQVAKNLYLGVEVGGVVTNEIVAGSGTFATKSYVDTAVSTGTGSLGTMSTQNADAVAITGGSIDGVDITNGTVNYADMQGVTINSASSIVDSTIDSTTIGATTPSTGAFTTLTASSAPSAATDVVRKTDLDSAISALGSVFRYVGNVSLAATPFDLGTLPDISTGAYYRVDVAGTYVDATYPDVEAKVGDAFVFTAENGFQKLDNVDVVVSGTTDEIAVTGDENAGYTVALAGEFKDKVANVEDKVTELETKTQNIVGWPDTVAGTTVMSGVLRNASNNSNIDFDNNALTFTSSCEFGSAFVGTSLEVGGNAHIGSDVAGGNLTVNGNLVGNGTSQITDFIIDGGVY